MVRKASFIVIAFFLQVCFSLALSADSADSADKETVSVALVLSIETKHAQSSYKSLTNTGISQVTLVNQRRVEDVFPRQRASFIAKDRLVVIAYDKNNLEVSRYYVRDPRLIRAEFPDEQGHLTAQEFVKSKVNLPIILSENAQVSELSIFEPVWTGEFYDLRLLGAVSLEGKLFDIIGDE